jgi:hypothetical protein
VEGREIEFIVRSLVELKLQVEELRRRTEPLAGGSVGAGGPASSMGSGSYPALLGGMAVGAGYGAVEAAGRRLEGPGGGFGAVPRVAGGIEAPGAPPPPNVVVVRPGMTMAEIERASIEAALRELRGNRRKAAEMLGIGERTLYRKLQEYHILDTPEAVEAAGTGAATNVPTDTFG